MIDSNTKHGPPGEWQMLIHTNRGAPLFTNTAATRMTAETTLRDLLKRGKPPETGEECLVKSSHYQANTHRNHFPHTGSSSTLGRGTPSTQEKQQTHFTKTINLKQTTTIK